MRYLVPIAVICILLGACACLGLRTWREDTTVAPAAPSQDQPVTTSALGAETHVQFRELAKAAGIDFLHDHSRTEMHYVPEIMGSGVAWIDYDQDGYLDLFLVQGGKFPPDPRQSTSELTSRLYRNQGDGTFVDVTAQVGLWHPDFGQGVAVGDYDNDGYPDLFVACYGHCHLYHNEADSHGSRRFREVTREAGVELDGWCTSCAFGDVHGNGYLDLFACRYVQMDLEHYPYCAYTREQPPIRYTCGPREFRGNSSVLFRNNGNGTFTNVSKEAGIDPDGKGLGVMILDLDGDGKVDIFVGNDKMPNYQYRNLGNGKFDSCGVISGTAADWKGTPMASMGVDAEDTTGSGRPDVFVTTFFHEGTTLFRNNGQNLFADVSQSAGMYAASWDRVGWGTCFLDVDHDGAPDLLVSNGHVYRNADAIAQRSETGIPNTYRQPAQLFRNNGKGFFQEISKDAGPYFQEGHVGRGLAMGDYDNDGAMDVAINQCGEPAALLHNETRTLNHWIRLQLEGTQHLHAGGSNRDAIGACVTLKAGGRTLVRHVKGGCSYLSAPDRRLLIGLGTAERVDEVLVRWPNVQATEQRFGPLAVERSYRLVEGELEALPAKCPPLRTMKR